MPCKPGNSLFIIIIKWSESFINSCLSIFHSLDQEEGKKKFMMASAYVDPKKRSVFTYHRVLLFNYNVQCKNPFASYNKNMFSEEEIPQSWFTGPLTPSNRRKKLSLSSLGGGRFSVFAKIEICEYQKCIFRKTNIIKAS